MEEWKQYRLGDICSIYGRIGFRGYTTEDLTNVREEGAISLSPTNIVAGELDLSKPTFIKWDKYYESPEIMIRPYDIVIVKTGSSVGRTTLIREVSHPMTLNPQLVVLKDLRVNPIFLSYLIKTREFQGALQSITVGSAIPTLSQKNLANLQISIPSDDTQNRISGILNSLDKKILLNNRINHNLEEQAQALFKSWFIDFEPFKDGKFVDSELGLIPETLRTSKICDLCHTIETGRRPKGGIVDVVDGVPSIGAENIKGLGFYDFGKTKYVSRDFAASMKKGLVKGYELLIYKDGGKPGYFIPNFSIFGEGFPYDNMTVNEHVFILDFKDIGYNVFSYFFFQTEVIMNYLNAQGSKAAIPGINRNDVESITIFSQNNVLVKEFGQRITPIITSILKRNVENHKLSIIRDSLLPRLMSEKIDLDNSAN